MNNDENDSMANGEAVETIEIPDEVSVKIDRVRIYKYNSRYSVVAFARDESGNYDEHDSGAVFTPGVRQYVSENAETSIQPENVGTRPWFGGAHR